MGKNKLSRNVGNNHKCRFTFQKSEDLTFTQAKAWNQPIIAKQTPIPEKLKKKSYFL
jgi:hypothetical protein